jgi:hypothetical protein
MRWKTAEQAAHVKNVSLILETWDLGKVHASLHRNELTFEVVLWVGKQDLLTTENYRRLYHSTSLIQLFLIQLQSSCLSVGIGWTYCLPIVGTTEYLSVVRTILFTGD